MPSGAIYRNATTPKVASPNVCPIYCDSDDNKLKVIPAGSGTTEVELVDASSSQTLTNKTLTSPTITTPSMTGVKQTQPVTSLTAATKAPSAAESGTLFLCNKADGIAVTLPAPAAGLWYEFYFQTTMSGGNFTITTDAGTTFLEGTVSAALEATTPGANPGPKFFSGNGTSHTVFTANGSTQGGLKGSLIRVVCVDATHWFISGINLCSGTIATNFS